MEKIKSIILVAFILLSIEAYSQKKMTLFFKDGTTQTGYVTFKKKELKLQAKLKGKKEKIDYALLDSASSYVNPRAKRAKKPKTVYILPTRKEDKQYRVYEIVKKGTLNLYKYSTYGGYAGMWLATGGTPGSSVFVPSGGSNNVSFYGLKREGESFVTILGDKDSSVLFLKISDSFKTQGRKYFSDCPSLSEKINNKEEGFTKKDIKNVVDYYNSECSKD